MTDLVYKAWLDGCIAKVRAADEAHVKALALADPTKEEIDRFIEERHTGRHPAIVMVERLKEFLAARRAQP